ncbi:hypothetical protein BD413DRAFT_237614 [Trametes elegans]|nr:hypothetical protein BD413DRAFT_237614 [Trametes elegans]
MSDLNVIWTGPAEEALKKLDKKDFGGVDPRKWHEDKVKNFKSATSDLKTANKARIRAPAHSGGNDPNEKDHITVTYKQNNKDINSPKGGAWHVYTGR